MPPYQHFEFKELLNQLTKGFTKETSVHRIAVDNLMVEGRIIPGVVNERAGIIVVTSDVH